MTETSCLPMGPASWTLFICAGMISGMGMSLARFVGEDLLGSSWRGPRRSRPRMACRPTRSRIGRTAGWLWVVALACSGCSDSTKPLADANSFDLMGEWNYSFVAADAPPCESPGGPQGCGGAGTLRFDQVGRKPRGSGTQRSACQTCGMAWDLGGDFVITDAVLRGSALEFTISECRFQARLPAQASDTVSGTVTCTLAPGVESHGTWQMTRIR